MARDHERYVEDLAPYLLCALEPLEAEALEKHLRGCGDCQLELVKLRTGAEAIARSVERIEPPASLRARLLEEVTGESQAPAADALPSPSAQRRSDASLATEGSRTDRPGARGRAAGRALARLRPRRRAAGPMRWPRPAVALVATALVAGVAGLAGWALGSAGRDEPRTVAATVDRERLPNASGRLRLTAEGELPVLHLEGLRNLGPQRTYELWVQRDGELSPGPLFSPTADGTAVTGVPGDAEDIEAVLVTRERAGGARTPTESPVVTVPVPS